MSTLAARLDELAQANSDGLLNDDEYRVLRQDLFLRYAGANEPLVEAPLIPSIATVENYPYPSMIGRVEVSFNSLPKNSKPGAQRPSISPRHWPSLPSHEAVSPLSPVTPLSPSKPHLGLFSRRVSIKKDTADATNSKEKRAFIPRINFTRKISDISLHISNSDSKESAGKPKAKLSSRKPSWSDKSTIQPPPLSPSRSSGSSSNNSRMMPPTPTSSKISSSISQTSSPRPSLALSTSSTSLSRRRIAPGTAQLPSSSSEIFDDTNLTSAAVIRSTIDATHVELRTLVEMFDQMEERVIEKLAEKRDKLGITAPLVDLATTSPPSHASVPSSQHIPPQPQVKRKASLSSMTSLAASSFSNLSTTLRPPQAISRSQSSNAAQELVPVAEYSDRMGSLRSIKSAQSLRRQRSTRSPIPFTPIDEDLELSEMLKDVSLEDKEKEAVQSLRVELKDVRKRKDEVMWRYNSRVEYLRARLKGAELAEKVAKR